MVTDVKQGQRAAMALPGMQRCDECGTPVLRLEGTTVVIQQRHHGTTHTTRIPLQQLVDKGLTLSS